METFIEGSTMKRIKTAFGYKLVAGKTTINVLTQVRNDENKSSYVVEHEDGRKLFPRSLKGAKVIVADFEEHYKIFNRKKVTNTL